MNKIIEKSDLIAARQHASDSEQALAAHASRNLNGLSNEQMVDVELTSIDLAYKRDIALKDYQEMLYSYHAQEIEEAAKGPSLSAVERSDRFEGKGKI